MSLVYLPTRFTTDFFNLSCGSRLKYDTTKYLPLFGSVYVILHGILDNNLSLSLFLSLLRNPRSKNFFFNGGLEEKPEKTKRGTGWQSTHTHTKDFILKFFSLGFFCLGIQESNPPVPKQYLSCKSSMRKILFADHNKIYDAFICGPLLFNLYRLALVWCLQKRF